MTPSEILSPATRRWFTDNIGAPTRVQREGWPVIARGGHALLIAPTGTGKTLAAFLVALDRLLREPPREPPGVRVLYISPLKALVHDVDKNLRGPLAGLREAATGEGAAPADVAIDVRTGDTPAAHRRRQAARPPHILATTPESLFLLLGSQARESLRTVDTVIVDEIHALAGEKRGVHLALSLERLCELTPREPQRVGLSATVSPPNEVAGFLAGSEREVEIVDASTPPALALEVVSPKIEPAADSSAGAEAATGWDAVEPYLLEVIGAHRQVIVFVNSRGLCERLAQRLNERAGEQLVRPHHGSVARQQREATERALKAGELRGIVATSSLELGIDMGAVDRVVLVDSPGSVARGLQRVGRAGHHVGAASAGTLIPKFRGDLLETAAVARGMLRGAIEPLAVPANPLDVLAQQIVAACADAPRTVTELGHLVRRAYPYRDLGERALASVLEMLSGRYRSSALADLRPRLSWDRARDRLTARRGAAMLTRLNAGTIPDRGSFPVLAVDGERRIGELDEEMVFESRPGDVFALGASAWRIESIARDRVLASPAPGEPGRLPFWRGEGLGRPVELGRAIGTLARELLASSREAAVTQLREQCALTAGAAGELLDLLADQRERSAVPTDADIVVERFRDALGDWRVCVLTPFGSRVHAPWALAIAASVGGTAAVRALHTDDGIALTAASSEAPLAAHQLLPDPEGALELTRSALASAPLFAGRFRENAARALLIPRQRPGKRSPLWQQRLKAAQLLAAVRDEREFPIVLETYRQCLDDVFDLAALAEILGAIAHGTIRVHEVETTAPSPLARSLAFAYEAAYLYEQDAPLAERRAQALAVDPELLQELLGEADLGAAIEPAAIDQVEAELQGTAEGFQARDADDLHDLLRRTGDLSEAEIAARIEEGADASELLAELARQRRALALPVAGESRWIDADRASSYDALAAGAQGSAPLADVIATFARSRGPFTSEDVRVRYAAAPEAVAEVTNDLVDLGTLVRGSFRPHPHGEELCHADVLRRLKRRSRDALRGELEPADGPTVTRFIARWQGLGAASEAATHADAGADDAIDRAIGALEGYWLPWDALLSAVLPARISGFEPAALDRATQSGAIVWVGAPGGRIALYSRERAARLLSPDLERDLEAPRPAHTSILDRLESRGACFLDDLDSAARAAEPGIEPAAIDGVIWELVWAGRITNDTLGPFFRPLRPPASRPRARRLGVTRVAGGRWSSTRELRRPDTSSTERAHALAEMLLARYGIAGAPAATAEAVPGGFGAVYRVLRAMEDRGALRRGRFVDAWPGAQFAEPEAVEALRAAREADATSSITALAAVDPAQPYGALLPWPAPSATDAPMRRAAGGWVILDAGAPVLYAGPAGKKLWSFRDAPITDAALAALRDRPRPSRRPLTIEELDGQPITRSPLWDAFLRAGFVRDYRGLTPRP